MMTPTFTTAAALVNGWFVDPIDKWRLEQRRLQFITPAKDEQDSLGTEGVKRAARALAGVSAEKDYQLTLEVL